jgi:2-polyprenyl-3-methyl-5-hydroxy-6-metoxy-1,4-benzoquinol methylase
MSILKKYYNRENAEYGITSSRTKKIMDFFEGIRGKKVLDVGCAGGYLGKRVKDLGNEVSGIDISYVSIKESEKVLDKAFVVDIQEENFPFEANYFDIVILSEVIEHLFFPEIALEKIKMVLKENGKLIITTPNLLVFSNRIRILFGYFEYTEKGIIIPEHIRFFSHDSLVKFLKKNGFKVMRENNIIHPKIPEFLGNIFPNLFSYQMVIEFQLE